jgi:hypothetical protein
MVGNQHLSCREYCEGVLIWGLKKPYVRPLSLKTGGYIYLVDLPQRDEGPDCSFCGANERWNGVFVVVGYFLSTIKYL